jgi:hypothetical protein
MESTVDVQQLFFQHIKAILPPHLSLVEEIAEHLSISNDSAYRRIRGEKPISFEEIRKLCSAYKISLDHFLHLQSDSFIFTGKLPENTDHFFENWLNDLLINLSMIQSFEKKHFYFLAKDLPFVSFFQIPELATFKIFLWLRTFVNHDEIKTRKFSLKNNYPAYEELGRKIIRVYNQIPTTEIWNLECLSATLWQIEFYREANVFESREDILTLYDKLEELVNHCEQQAETGKKFGLGEKPTAGAADYQLFINELFLGDNTVIAELNNTKMSFLNHSVLHNVATRDERFSNFTYDAMMNLIRKSTQISTVGEKSRTRFFNALREEIFNKRIGVN